MPQYELNLRDYWQIIRKRRGVLILIFITVLISTIFYTNLQESVYRATASVQWIKRQTLGGLLTDLFTVQIGDPLITQSKIITSIPVLEKVAMELGLVGKDASPAEIAERAGFLQGLVSTDIATRANIIYINVRHNDPQMVAKIANKVADVYIVESLKEKTKESRGVREFIEKQLEELSNKLKNSEETLARFKELEVPSGVALPLQDRLAELETKRRDLIQQYTPLHPDIKNIDEQINQVKEQLKTLPYKELEYNRLTREVEINADLYRKLKDKLEAARITEAEKAGDASLVDWAVPPASPISPNRPFNYLLGVVIGLLLGLAGTFMVEQLDTSIGTIEDVEGYLKLPALGVIPYLKVKEEKTTFIKRFWLRELSGKDKILHLRNQLLIHYSISSPIFEAYRILRTNIQSEVFKDSKEKNKGRVLLFTSSEPVEGKSITVSNLAIAMAQGNLRTLLIDGDLRRSIIHKIFGLRKKEPGLSDILRGTVKPEEAIRSITDILIGEVGFDEALKLPGLDNLNILTSGSSTTTPAEILASAEMVPLLEKFRDKFDFILMDSPPALAVADTAIMARKIEGVILVYRVGKTSRNVLSQTKTRLIDSGASVKGIVLNNISPQVEMRYGYYYHYKYYGKYYGEKKEET